MSRDLDPTMSAGLSAPLIIPIFLAMLTFRTTTKYVWTGVGNLLVDAQTYTGVGSFAQLSAINEGVEVQADGMTVSLSGIDPALLAESLTDIQLGATAKVWIGLMANGTALIGLPYLVFSGCIDQPAISPGADSITISLALESLMSDLARPNLRRYTSADQRLYFPDDTAFGWVEQLNDLALNWGQ